MQEERNETSSLGQRTGVVASSWKIDKIDRYNGKWEGTLIKTIQKPSNTVLPFLSS
jgi:hypothetical protein